MEALVNDETRFGNREQGSETKDVGICEGQKGTRTIDSDNADVARPVAPIIICPF